MANEQNLKPIKDSNVARELQEKSVIKRKENAFEKLIFKEAIKELMTQADFKEIILNQIERAKNSDNAYMTLRDTLGQKPKEQIEQKQDIKISMDNNLDNWGK